MATKAIVSFDGGARPTNPGHAGFACVVTVGSQEKVISRYIGITTNNVAEYYGLIVGIKYAHFLGARELTIFTDSKLVREQVLGNWQCKSESLKTYMYEARDLLKKLYTQDGELLYEIVWQKRDKNSDADDYCTKAITWGRNLNPFTPSSIKVKRGVGAIEDPFASTRTVPVRQGRVRPDGLSTILSDFT